jgi:hypothetical protein
MKGEAAARATTTAAQGASAPSATFADALVEAMKSSGQYNVAEFSRPVAILWPDSGNEWGPLIPSLRERLPLLTLGQYDAASRSGPAHWILCMLAGRLADKLPSDVVPVVYLPGVSKQDLRAIEECRGDLQPIASMQYAGVVFTQANGKDWSIRAFLESRDAGGLGIPFGADADTKRAAQRSLQRLADVSVSTLRTEAPLRTGFFDNLMNPDQVKTLLSWMNSPEGHRNATTTTEWEAFRSGCTSKYSFDPERDGVLKAALLLGERMDSAWELAWKRFTEAPAIYPNLPALLRRARPKKDGGLFAHRDAWPQDNESAEAELRAQLTAIGGLMAADARAETLKLNDPAGHGTRRNWVWAVLGMSPLAKALEPLAGLASLSGRSLSGTTPNALGDEYAEWAWQIDRDVLNALAAVQNPEDVGAVRAAVKAMYRPWVEDAAKQFQTSIGDGLTYAAGPIPDQTSGTCLLFVDGLRLDVGHRLAERLRSQGHEAQVDWRLGSLPTITSSAKATVTPAADQLKAGPELAPVTATGTTVDAAVLRRLIREAGRQVLDDTDPIGDPSGVAWAETGDLDEIGHTKGCGLARQVDAALAEVQHRISGLLAAGWSQVIVVTDHGFLLMPDGLHKVQLAEHLTVVRKGRCARMKPSSTTEYQTVPWHWDPATRFAMAPGISCFEAGKEYEHGGISVQECVTPVLNVRSHMPNEIAIQTLTWHGLRCKIAVVGAPVGSVADLRRQPASPVSSVASGGKRLDSEGKASLLVEDDALLSEEVFAVIYSPTGAQIQQVQTTVGSVDD